MNSPSQKRVHKGRQRDRKGFAFAGLHFHRAAPVNGKRGKHLFGGRFHSGFAACRFVKNRESRAKKLLKPFLLSRGFFF